MGLVGLSLDYQFKLDICIIFQMKVPLIYCKKYCKYMITRPRPFSRLVVGKWSRPAAASWVSLRRPSPFTVSRRIAVPPASASSRLWRRRPRTFAKSRRSASRYWRTTTSLAGSLASRAPPSRRLWR